MSISSLRSGISGALFGAALTAAGIFSPKVIIGQLRFENFHMLKTFLTASACSAIFIALAQKFNLTNCKPRLPNSIGIFSKYDGNMIGGTLLGFGLALTGACPGTIIPLFATGASSGPLVLTGAILGGALYSRFGKQLQRSVFTKIELEKPTVQETIGVSHGSGILVFVTTCLAVVGSAEYFLPSSTTILMPAAMGGLLIGLSQGTSLLLTGNTLGLSTAYEQFGEIFCWVEKSIFEPGTKTASPKITANMLFALGATVGSYGVSKLVDLPPLVPVDISTSRALLGGAIMIFGARLAGGCTSGHGISGMSQLSISSIISVAAMFAGGMGLSAVLY